MTTPRHIPRRPLSDDEDNTDPTLMPPDPTLNNIDWADEDDTLGAVIDAFKRDNME